MTDNLDKLIKEADKTARRLTIFGGALIVMLVIVLVYKFFVEPKEPTWHSQAKVWKEVPITVTWDSDFWGYHNNSFTEAIESINRQVGCKLFVHESPAQVVIKNGEQTVCDQVGVGVGQDEAAGAWLCEDGTADIQILQPGDIGMSYLIAQHELLHVAGLDHDSFSESIMMSGTQELSEASPGPRLTDKDRSVLYERYCDE